MILNDIPQYETTVPSTGKKIKFRPFLVKEYKILLIAMETGSPIELNTAIALTVEACTEKAIDILNAPFFDIEWLYMQIRKKSMSEKINVILQDGENKFDYQLSLENIVLENNTPKDKQIKLSSTLAIELEYPSFQAYQEMLMDKEKNMNAFDALFLLMAKSVKTIYHQESTYNKLTLEERQNFINNLPADQFEKIAKFFETLPKIVLRENLIGPFTGKPLTIEIMDFRDFFV
jgi:hypothetical protein